MPRKRFKMGYKAISPSLTYQSVSVWISSDPMISMEANYNEKLLKVRNCLSCCEYHQLSLLGKIVMLESYHLSTWLYPITFAN